MIPRAILVVLLWCTTSLSQTHVIKVWPHGAPGATLNSAYKEDTAFTETHAPRISHVTDPELLVYLPKNQTPTHPAVVICPGGGYARLAMDHEGYDVAAWFTQMGIAGIVLKYRLPSDEIMQKKALGPLQDVQEAIRIVRRSAKEWNIDPRRIGVMGFSAGGHLAGSASTLYWYKCYERQDTTSARPDFSLLIYGVLSMQEGMTHGTSRLNLLGGHPDSALVALFSAEKQVTSETPPAFLVHSADDPTVPVENSLVYFSALQKHTIPAELHIYERGGHGYGLAKNGGSESGWPEACRAWLKEHSFLP